MSAPANTGFWDFSLRVYARDGVAEACLGLQDRRGADVNLLLYCGWAAATGRGALGADELKRLVDLTGPWQNSVVQPLRQVRRGLKELGWLQPKQQPRGRALHHIRTGRWRSDVVTNYFAMLSHQYITPSCSYYDCVLP